jgi:hypothetical protein
MRLMTEAEGYARPNREMELRVFGRLLRDGTIRRAEQRGLFEIAGASRFAGIARRFSA